MAIQQFIESVCVQTAVYWAPDGADGYGGKTYKTPIEVPVRWDYKREVVKDDMGREVVSNAQILIPVDVQNGGWLYLGTLNDLNETQFSDPKGLDGTFEIIQFTKVSMPKSLTDFVRMAYV
jgi:hypothetical protein